MDYKEFDKIPDGIKMEDRIYFLLKDNPYNIEEISRKLGLNRTTIIYHLKKLDKKLSKKMFGNKIYYGLKNR